MYFLHCVPSLLCSHSEVSLCSEEAAAEDDDEAMADAGEVNARSTRGQREVTLGEDVRPLARKTGFCHFLTLCPGKQHSGGANQTRAENS